MHGENEKCVQNFDLNGRRGIANKNSLSGFLKLFID
jgi:hypothetical protein